MHPWCMAEGGSLPRLLPAEFLQAARPGMERAATDAGLHPWTPGVTPASDPPLALHCLARKTFYFIFYFFKCAKASAVAAPPFPGCPSWGWELGLRCTSQEEPPKIVLGALSGLLPANQTCRGLGALLAPRSWGTGVPAKGFGGHILVGSWAA